MKAMSSFDPKTISAMTTDTKKLLETQKGLMQMLTQMRPVLADGKELLNTFTGMFGGGGAVVPGAM
jgi:predicted component of type VI protein secretion system